MSSPYYVIEFSASACWFEIRINDYPVITMNIEGQASSIIPINYAILKSGTQAISCTVLPNVGNPVLELKTEMSYDIKLFDVSNNNFFFVGKLSEYKSEPILEETIPLIKYTSEFNATVPYTLNAWQSGEKLGDIKDLKEKLRNAYQQVGDLIRAKKYEDFKQIVSQREANMSTSMYLSSKESEKRITELISDFDSGFEVMPVPADSALFVYGYDKVAALKRVTGESGLYLFNKETQEELAIDITFFIPKGKTAFEII